MKNIIYKNTVLFTRLCLHIVFRQAGGAVCPVPNFYNMEGVYEEILSVSVAGIYVCNIRF